MLTFRQEARRDQTQRTEGWNAWSSRHVDTGAGNIPVHAVTVNSDTKKICGRYATTGFVVNASIAASSAASATTAKRSKQHRP